MTIKINNLPAKYEKMWEICIPYLEQGRPGDVEHSKEVVEKVIEYSRKMKIDLEVLIPVAMMHDIGHSAILPEHFKHVTGPEKIRNGKLVHMLAGAKIARDILESVKYDEEKSKEIIEIISMHDYDQLEDTDDEKTYDTDNKRAFHDIDSLDRFNERRLKKELHKYKNKEELFASLEPFIDKIFSKEIRDLARKEFEESKKKIE